MKLLFTKGSGKHDRMDFTRPDGKTESIDCPKQRIIPHDMVHYAVESTLDARGFLGRIRDGEAANFRMMAEAESDAIERLVEVFQGDAWSGGSSPAVDMIDLYRITCEARQCPMLPIDATIVDSVRNRIADLTGQWQDVAVGGVLELEL